MKVITNCLSQGDFLVDWDQWISKVDQAAKTTDKITFPDKSLEIDSKKASQFLSGRLLVVSQENSLIKDLWNIATPGERKVIGEILFRLMHKSARRAGKQAPDEPYGGY